MPDPAPDIDLEALSIASATAVASTPYARTRSELLHQIPSGNLQHRGAYSNKARLFLFCIPDSRIFCVTFENEHHRFGFCVLYYGIHI